MRLNHFVPPLLVFTFFAAAPCLGQDATQGEPAEAMTELIENFCLDCHNSADAIGGLNLEDFDNVVTTAFTPPTYSSGA